MIVQDASEEDSIRVRDMLSGLLHRHPWVGP